MRIPTPTMMTTFQNHQEIRQLVESGPAQRHNTQESLQMST